jgi:signal transduction histidine kinase
VAQIDAVPTILKVVSEVTGLRLALIARVTEDQWTALAVLDRMNFGLSVGDHLDVATTLCSEVRATSAPIIIEHASEEPDYCQHPTPKMYNFQSYIAVPIFRTTGEYFGNVCALDAAPAPLRDAKTLGMMRLFAELIALQLDNVEQSTRDREALSSERETAELREQFIAVLGHDLRNPLGAIMTGTAILLNGTPDPASRTVLERIRRSGRRMSRLIDDILDFARGRLGGGITLARESLDAVSVVRDVVEEISSTHPGRCIRVAAGAAVPAHLDRSRIAQMLSNLVGNAVEHGSPEQPIDVSVQHLGDRLSFIVVSLGAPISSELMPRLFQPYFRPGAGDAAPRTGLGLGLYIAAEIARAHGGTIAADSTPEGKTTFIVTMPRDA